MALFMFSALTACIVGYRQYRAALKAIPITGKFMPYDWVNLPPTLPFTWAAYAEMFQEFSRELANIINGLTRIRISLRVGGRLSTRSTTGESSILRPSSSSRLAPSRSTCHTSSARGSFLLPPNYATRPG
jgi:hypothetical protein